MEEVSYVRVSPTLPVRDVRKAIEFYQRALGLEQRSVYGDPPTFAIVGAGDVFIQLSLDREGSTAGRAGCYITVTGVERLFERCRAAGADLDSGLAVRDYGMRDFVVHDADENHISVGESVRAA
ncbi:MAG TPA: VOC family protein [Dehalococcoidia bacterium]|nr:VOC family protein [Dehalococcoidia bacterium]